MPNVAYVGHAKRGAGSMNDMGNTDWCDLGKFYEVWVNGECKGRYKEEEAALRKVEKLRSFHSNRLYTIYEVTPQRVKTKSWLPDKHKMVIK